MFGLVGLSTTPLFTSREMATTKLNHFDIDWWVIQKRAVYAGVLLVALCAIAGGAALYIWKYGNPLKNVADKSENLPGARFMSFEGDVRVIRAATRQVLIANSDVQLYPGDTVQTILINEHLVAIEKYVDAVFRPPATGTAS